MCAHYYATYSNYARGVCVFVHRSLQFRLMEVKTDRGGRIVFLHVYIANVAFVIVGLYIPPPLISHYCILFCNRPLSTGSLMS